VVEQKKAKRIFVAIALPEAVIQELVRLQELMKNLPVLHATYPLPQHIHVTLAFVGMADESTIKAIDQVLQSIFFPSCAISLSRLDYFGSLVHGAVVYVSVISDALIELGTTIQAHLHAQRLMKQSNQSIYIPHLTIARIKSARNSESVLEFIQTSQTSFIDFTVHEFYLFESSRVNGELTHRILYRYALGT
jgi:2'-5' RNA ligase